MTATEVQQLKLALVTTAAYYGQSITDDVLCMMASDLADLSFDDVAHALAGARRDPKVTRFPLPAQIRQRIAPELTEGQEAREIAAKVIGAVTKCGYPNPVDAREYVGELGWRCIEMLGGWSSFCRTLSDFNVATLQAQIRELAEGQVIQFKTSDASKLLSERSLNSRLMLKNER